MEIPFVGISVRTVITMILVVSFVENAMGGNMAKFMGDLVWDMDPTPFPQILDLSDTLSLGVFSEIIGAFKTAIILIYNVIKNYYLLGLLWRFKQGNDRVMYG